MFVSENSLTDDSAGVDVGSVVVCGVGGTTGIVVLGDIGGAAGGTVDGR